MTVRDVPRLAVGGSLKLLRLPADVALRFVPGQRMAPSVKVAIDRADATARGIAGTLLADAMLQEDARQRHEAAGERERALRLRVAAERRAERADDAVAEGREEAARRRQRAAEDAERERGEARRRSAAKKRSAEQTAKRRRSASARSAAKSEQAIEERGQRARLDALDSKAVALNEKEKAQTAADEARRLRAASSGAKAKRKST